ncbi:MAG: hypothetical protein II798_05160, partial [Lachnospiraceae bacterium]|nr:hypothetical protein [Lachnospiraceae bacterium]
MKKNYESEGNKTKKLAKIGLAAGVFLGGATVSTTAYAAEGENGVESEATTETQHDQVQTTQHEAFQVTRPAGSQEKPAEDQEKPAEDQEKPAEDQEKPAEDQEKPAEEQDVLGEKREIPTDGEEKTELTPEQLSESASLSEEERIASEAASESVEASQIASQSAYVESVRASEEASLTAASESASASLSEMYRQQSEQASLFNSTIASENASLANLDSEAKSMSASVATSMYASEQKFVAENWGSVSASLSDKASEVASQSASLSDAGLEFASESNSVVHDSTVLGNIWSEHDHDWSEEASTIQRITSDVKDDWGWWGLFPYITGSHIEYHVSLVKDSPNMVDFQYVDKSFRNLSEAESTVASALNSLSMAEIVHNNM